MARGYRTPYRSDVDGRECSACREYKPWSSFNLHKSGHNGRKSACKPCCNEAQRDYAKANLAQVRRRHRDSQYRRRFGLSLEEVEARMEAVGNKCEACGTHKSETWNGALVLDHEHGCCPGENTCGGCIVGILCTNCNVALGALRDSSARLEGLLQYNRRRNG